jgi:hypothetical protein
MAAPNDRTHEGDHVPRDVACLYRGGGQQGECKGFYLDFQQEGYPGS